MYFLVKGFWPFWKNVWRRHFGSHGWTVSKLHEGQFGGHRILGSKQKKSTSPAVCDADVFWWFPLRCAKVFHAEVETECCWPPAIHYHPVPGRDHLPARPASSVSCSSAACDPPSPSPWQPVLVPSRSVEHAPNPGPYLNFRDTNEVWCPQSIPSVPKFMPCKSFVSAWQGTHTGSAKLPNMKFQSSYMTFWHMARCQDAPQQNPPPMKQQYWNTDGAEKWEPFGPPKSICWHDIYQSTSCLLETKKDVRARGQFRYNPTISGAVACFPFPPAPF